MVLKYLYKIDKFIDFTSIIYYNYIKCQWF